MGLPYFVRAHLYVGGAHIHKRALRGRAVEDIPFAPDGAKQRLCLWNWSCADSTPMQRAVLRRQRSCAESSPVRTACLFA